MSAEAKDNYLKELEEIIDQDEFKANPATNISRFRKFLEEIFPLGSSLLDQVDELSSRLLRIEENAAHATQAAHAAVSSGFTWGALGLSILNFVRIPLVFLAARIAGEKPPVKLSKGAKWSYSAALLGLTIAALALPAVAPFLAIASVSLILVSSVIVFANFFREKRQLPVEIKALDQAIEEKPDINEIQNQAYALHQKIFEASLQKIEPSKSDVEAFKALQKQVKEIQDLYDKREEKKVMLAKIGTSQLVNNSVSVALSALAVAGFITALFFPPTGLALLTVAASVGLTYVVGRILFPKLKETKLGLWIAKRFKSKKEEAESSEESADSIQKEPEFSVAAEDQPVDEIASESVNTIQIEPEANVAEEEQPIHETTTDIMQRLDENRAEKFGWLMKITTTALNSDNGKAEEFEDEEKLSDDQQKVLNRLLKYFNELPKDMGADDSASNAQAVKAKIKKHFHDFDLDDLARGLEVLTPDRLQKDDEQVKNINQYKIVKLMREVIQEKNAPSPKNNEVLEDDDGEGESPKLS